MMFWLKVVFAISSLSFIASETCDLFETCGECIGNSLNCAWCSDSNHTGPRCISSQRLNTAWCMKPYNPQIEKEKSERTEGNQFTPSNIIIKARPGDTVPFEITYKPTTDYPIDIYFLFDNSWTMRSYKKDLINQAHKIKKTLEVESNNVRFGAGSFVEKLALPFASAADTALNTFNNHLSLTNNTDIFVETVNNTKSSGNLDDPECGLDALMQAMICEEEIGWRPDARRLIILSTDDVYHSAGDGRAVGAFKQNDMKCHLVNAGKPNIVHTYDLEALLLYDYPSVSQVNYVASKKNILIFFVAKKTVAREYEALAQAIIGAEFVELAVDEENNDLAEIIKTQYKSLTQNLKISPPELPPHLQLNLKPDCTSKVEQCKVPHHGSTKLSASLYVKSCPKDNKYKHTFIIKSAGLSDKVTVEVEVLCECDCERKGQKKSPICGVNGISHGTYQCGVCKCDNGWYGKTCQCEGDSSEKEDLLKCTPPSVGAKPCSGRGICGCEGICKCWEGYSGIDQCQYRTDDCPTYDEKMCAGHGSCLGGNCSCIGPWTGVSCECSTNKDTCVGANGQICSGNGNCKCGACVCKNEPKNYEGKYCDKCDTCGEERCEHLKEYVNCMYDGKKKSCDEKHNIKTNIAVEIKNITEVEGWTEGFYCKAMLPDESSIVYKYYDDNNSTLIWIQKEKGLPPERNIWIPIGIAIGTMLLIGILTLIAWKVLVDIHDAREYRKFAKEAEKSGFEVQQNPLYKPAAVSINNPAYTQQG